MKFRDVHQKLVFVAPLIGTGGGVGIPIKFMFTNPHSLRDGGEVGVN